MLYTNYWHEQKSGMLSFHNTFICVMFSVCCLATGLEHLYILGSLLRQFLDYCLPYFHEMGMSHCSSVSILDYWVTKYVFAIVTSLYSGVLSGFSQTVFNPLNPKIKIKLSLFCCRYTSPISHSREKLLKYKASSLGDPVLNSHDNSV